VHLLFEWEYTAFARDEDMHIPTQMAAAGSAAHAVNQQSGGTQTMEFTPEEFASAISHDLAAIEALGPYAERSEMQQHLDSWFAPKRAPNGCERCGRIYEAFGDYPDGEYNIGRAHNPCQECKEAMAAEAGA
jgi:hypothetical protein